LPSKKGEMDDRMEPSAADSTKYLSLQCDEHRAFLPSLSGESTSDSPMCLLALEACLLSSFFLEKKKNP